VSLDVIFAHVGGVLAGLAVIGALAFVLVWEWCAIRRILAADRCRASDGAWRESDTLVPTKPAEHDLIRQGARRVLAGDSLGEIALDPKGRGLHGWQQP
jgi:hypothetical protein